MTIQTTNIIPPQLSLGGSPLTFQGEPLRFAALLDPDSTFVSQGNPLTLVITGDFDGGTITVSVDDFATGDFVEVASYTEAGRYVTPYLRAGAVVKIAITGAVAPDVTVRYEVDDKWLSVNILPNVVRQAELQQASRVKAWVRQQSPIFCSVYDTANNAVDLSTFTGVKFTVATANGVELLVVPSTDLTITGTDNNTLYFDPPTELVERARVLQWSIRDESDDEHISSGTLEIVFAP
jgi:hypothetical protein